MVNKGVLTIEFYKSKDQSEENKIGILDMELPPALDLEVNIFGRRSIISFHLLIIAVPNSTPCHSLEQTRTSQQRVQTVQSHFNFQIYGWIRTIGTYFFIQLNRKVIVDMLVAIRF